MYVSILMGVYNAAKTVERAVASIFQQTYSDFELIVCDDGSTDESFQVLERCKNKYGSRLLLLRNEVNRGLAYTLNRCLELATGTYIARMDADDYALPKRLKSQVEFLNNHPDIAFVGCNAYMFDEKGIYDSIEYPEYPLKKDLLFNSCFLHPSIIIRKEVLERVDGYSETRFCVRCEDYDLWLRLYARGYRGANMQGKFMLYYEGQENLVKRKYRYRVNEAIVRLRGFYGNRMFVRGSFAAIKPLLLGLIPEKALQNMRRFRRKVKHRC